MTRRLVCALLAVMLAMGGARAMDRDQLRAAWREVEGTHVQESPYAERPDPERFTPGELSREAQGDALALVNLLRGLAGLEPVELDRLYGLRAQLGALTLAANDRLDHEPAQPEGMPDGLYESGFLGTSQGNIAQFNWMRPDILIDGVTCFARDDGDFNLQTLGHRRWLLNPAMAATGFGLANAASGNSYVVMYAVDMGNADAEWDHVSWPAAGTFPVELMRAELAWSVSLNPEVYDLARSHPVVELTERVSGARFRFDFATGAGDGYCRLSTERCGSGDCLIFRPKLASAGIEEYMQNQIWTVEITGLVGTDGEERPLSYTCEMASVYPQDVANVELSQLEAALSPGEALQLRADVIPAWADDLRLTWTSSDERVATVDGAGLVTALAPGECEISATSANGRGDTCKLSVE